MSATAATMFALAGVNLGAGVLFAVIWWSQRDRSVYFWFAVVCLAVAGYIVPRAIRVDLSSVSAVIATVKWAEVMAQVFYATWPWFIGAYTGVPVRRFGLTLVALAGVCFVVTLSSPYGINHATVTGIVRLEQPWGDTVTTVEGTLSPVWYTLQTLGYVLCMALAIHAGVVQWRRGNRTDAVPLLVGQAVAILPQFWSVAFMLGFIRVIQVHEAASTVVILIVGGHLARDLRRQTQAASRLAASLAHAQRMTHVGSAEIELPSRRGTATEELYRIFGVEPRTEAVSPAVWLDQVHPDDRDALSRQVEAVSSGGGRMEVEYRIVRPDGGVRWIHGEAVVEGGDGGPPAILRGTAQDITEQKQAQQALAESERRYRTFFENSRDAFMTLGPPSWRYLSANPAMVRMFRAPDASAITLVRPWDVSPETQPDGSQSADAAMTMIETALRDGSYYFEWLHQRFDGEQFPASVLLTRLELYGEVVLQATVRDLTEQKRLEAQFIQAQKMEAVGKLAGGVAHDFNNMLQAVVGYGELALGEIGPGGPGRESLELSLQAAGRAGALVRQLLAFSRRQVLRLEVIDVSDVVADFSKMLRRVIGEHIAFQVRAEPGTHAVKADKSQIEQVLMNLCVNARDAMPAGGSLTIELGHADLDESFCRQHECVAPGRYVVLAVTDTGSGMDPAIRRRAFEPFFTTKEHGQGTGLGLSTVFGIVRQHRGVIDLDSRPGAGSTFRIYLPATDAPAATDDTSVPAPASGGTETILVADDDDQVRQVTTTILRRAGYQVLTASDGDEALRVFATYADTIALVMLDAVMPRLSGRAVHDRIASTRPALPVLFSTGYSMDGIHTDFELQEGVHLIEKPFSPADLLHRVRGLLDARPPAITAPARGGSRGSPRTDETGRADRS